MVRTAKDFAVLYRAVGEERERAQGNCALARALRDLARRTVSDSAEQRIRLQHARAAVPVRTGSTS